MAAVVVRRAPGSQALDSQRVRRIADRMLNELELADGELSVLLTNDVFIRSLNAKHRGKDAATDVLAFPMDDGAEGVRPGIRLLGDVVISIDTAARQAQKRRRPLVAEVAHLLAHGILHLVGYDHRDDREEREMNAMTRRLVHVALDANPAEKLLVGSLRGGS